MFDVLAVIMECSITCPIEAIAIMVLDSPIIRRLLAVVGSSIVSATTMDIEVSNAAGGGSWHSAGTWKKRIEVALVNCLPPDTARACK